MGFGLAYPLLEITGHRWPKLNFLSNSLPQKLVASYAMIPSIFCLSISCLVYFLSRCVFFLSVYKLSCLCQCATCDRQCLGHELHWWHYSQKCVGLVCPPQIPYQIQQKNLIPKYPGVSCRRVLVRIVRLKCSLVRYSQTVKRKYAIPENGASEPKEDKFHVRPPMSSSD